MPDENGKLLQAIHGKVCAIDERTAGHSVQLAGLHDQVGTLRERTAAQDTAIKHLEKQSTRRGVVGGAGAAGLVTVIVTTMKHLFGGTPS